MLPCDSGPESESAKFYRPQLRLRLQEKQATPADSNSGLDFDSTSLILSMPIIALSILNPPVLLNYSQHSLCQLFYASTASFLSRLKYFVFRPHSSPLAPSPSISPPMALHSQRYPKKNNSDASSEASNWASTEDFGQVAVVSNLQSSGAGFAIS